MKLLLLISFFFSSFFPGPKAIVDFKEIKVTEKFNRLTVHGNLKLILVPSDSASAVHYKDGKVTAEVSNNELVIKQKGNFFSNNQPVVIVKVKQLNAIKIKDDASVSTKGVLETDNLKVDFWGDETIKLSVTANNVVVCSRGKGKVEIEGTYKQTEVKKDETGCIVMEFSNN
jgi:hypothetical protein